MMQFPLEIQYSLLPNVLADTNDFAEYVYNNGWPIFYLTGNKFINIPPMEEIKVIARLVAIVIRVGMCRTVNIIGTRMILLQLQRSALNGC
jgi:hypothetical protein